MYLVDSAQGELKVRVEILNQRPFYGCCVFNVYPFQPGVSKHDAKLAHFVHWHSAVPISLNSGVWISSALKVDIRYECCIVAHSKINQVKH